MYEDVDTQLAQCIVSHFYTDEKTVNVAVPAWEVVISAVNTATSMPTIELLSMPFERCSRLNLVQSPTGTGTAVVAIET